MVLEPLIAWDKELALLKGEIDAVLEPDGKNFVHTLQIVTSASATLTDPMSRMWSCQPEVFERVVEGFTRYSGSDGRFTRSLVGEDYLKSPYWYGVLSGDARPIFDSPDNLDFRLWRQGPWTYTADETSLQEAKLTAWCESLKEGFYGRGATMWVTQSHGRRRNAALPTSSAFALFNDQLQAAQLYPVAKLLRDFLVGILGDMYMEALGKSQALNVTLLQDILRDPGTTRALGSSILHQLERLRRPIISLCPMLISGESGTGKMGVASRIHGIREHYFSASDKPTARSNHRPYVINVSELRGDRKQIRAEINRQMKTNTATTWEQKLAEQGRGVVIFDNVHAAAPAAQEVLRELIDDSLSIPTDRKNSWIPLRKPLFTSLPGLSVAATSRRVSA
jgi:hypothetical protein